MRLRGGGFQFAVNFDPLHHYLVQRSPKLAVANFQVPHMITNMEKDAKRVYPYAISVMETVRTYGQALELVEPVTEYRGEARRMVAKGTHILWPVIPARSLD